METWKRCRGCLIRFGPHSKGDDTRSVEELHKLRSTRDPLRILAPGLDAAVVESISCEVEAEVRGAYELALADPPALLEEGG